jgi:23S rRNA (cytidine1920-2'-O)/16S rRNA (cytidine1409-2'-O)-methyltransferase
VHRRVLEEVLAFSQEIGFSIRGLIRSPIQGPKGNTEFLVWLSTGPTTAADIPGLIEAALNYDIEE